MLFEDDCFTYASFCCIELRWSSIGSLVKKRVVTLVSASSDKPIAYIEAELAKNRISELKE
jgi:hypothetical protein